MHMRGKALENLEGFRISPIQSMAHTSSDERLEGGEEIALLGNLIVPSCSSVNENFTI